MDGSPTWPPLATSPGTPVLCVLSVRHTDRRPGWTRWWLLSSASMCFCSHGFSCVFTKRQLGMFPNLFIPVPLVIELHNLVKYYVNQWSRSLKSKLFPWNATLEAFKRSHKCKFLKVGMDETAVEEKRNHTYVQLYSGCFARFENFSVQHKETKIKFTVDVLCVSLRKFRPPVLSQKVLALCQKIGGGGEYLSVSS